MNELESGLAAMAARVTVEDRLDDLMQERTTVALDDVRPRGRVTLAAAAALVLIVGVGAVIAVRSDPDRSTSTISDAGVDVRAAVPEVFPTLRSDDPNASSVTATYGGFMSFADGDAGRALVGRIDGGELVDPVAISVYADVDQAPLGDVNSTGDDVVIDGVTYERRSAAEARSLVLRGEFDLVVTGEDPEAFVTAADGIPVSAVDAVPGGLTLSLAAMPAGYAVFVPPSTFPTPPYIASLATDTQTAIAIGEVRTSRFSELLTQAIGTSFRQVDVNGIIGWEIDDDQNSTGMVIWQVADHTWATALADSPAAARELARRTVFVDETTWLSSYDICADGSGWNGPPAYCIDGRATRTPPSP
jgi:hypothetical protein